MKFELNEEVLISGSQHPNYNSDNYYSDFFGKIISLAEPYNIKYCGPVFECELKVDEKLIYKINTIDCRVIRHNKYFKLNKGIKIIENGIEYVLKNEAILQSKDDLVIDKV